MNKSILMGRLTRDPEVRYSQGENTLCIARFTLAVDRRRSANNADNQTADFINIVAFGKNGEFAEKYLVKGTKVTLAGRIQTGSYTNKDGVKVYTTEVVVDEMEFAESKNAGANNNNAAPSNNGNGGNNVPPASPSNGDGFMNIPDGIDEELPFN